MSMLKNKFFVLFTILGIFFACSLCVNGATPTPTRRVAPTPTRRVTPTRRPTPTPTRRYVQTFYIEKVSDASEQGPQTGQFRLWSTQSGWPQGDGYVKVNYTISGTATNGVDYQSIPGYVWVMLGGGYVTPQEPHDYIYINPIADNLIEGTETVTITLTGVTVGAGKGSATLNISDLSSTPTPTATPTPTPTATPTPTQGVILNPTIPPGVTITFYVKASADAAEPPIGGSYGTPGSFTFWSTQTGPTTSNGYFKVNYTVSGTASNADYTVPNPGYGGLPGYVWVKVGDSPYPPLPSDTFINTASIRPLRDSLVEGTETLIVTLTGVNVGSGQGSATLNILDANSRVTPTPTPTATPTPTLPPTSVTPTPTPVRGGYVVTYTITSDWGGAANADVTIKNNTANAVNGWTLAWTFPGNQTITNLWNGSYTQSGASVSVKNLDYNATIAANGGTQAFGFSMSYSGTNAKPTAFTLNGAACSVQ